MPTYWVDMDTPTVEVKVTPGQYQDPSLIQSWKNVPFIEGVTNEDTDCSDLNLSINQVQPDGAVKTWEFWKFTRTTNPDGTISHFARHGGTHLDFQQDRGIASPTQWWDLSAPDFGSQRTYYQMNVTATSVAQSAGVVTKEEVREHRLNHALGLVLPDALCVTCTDNPATPDIAEGGNLWPAQRSDGGLTYPHVIGGVNYEPLPEGAKLWFPPSFDVEAYIAARPTMPELLKLVLRAGKSHGYIARDRSFASFGFYGEDIEPGEANPYTAAMVNPVDGTTVPFWKAFSSPEGPNRGMFPWKELVVVDPGPVLDTNNSMAPEQEAHGMCKQTYSSGCRLAQDIVINSNKAAPRVGQLVSFDTKASHLNEPRIKAEWDLDGDGAYEVVKTNGGAMVFQDWTPPAAGTYTINHRLTLRGRAGNGSVLTGSKTITVSP